MRNTEITKTFEFSMGHALWKYDGNCHNLHGHNYQLEVTVEGEIDERGFVMDFADLKTIWKDHVENRYDHRTLLFNEDDRFPPNLPGVRRVSYEPTAENLVIEIARDFGDWLDTVRIKQVALWETSTSKASRVFA